MTKYKANIVLVIEQFECYNFDNWFNLFFFISTQKRDGMLQPRRVAEDITTVNEYVNHIYMDCITESDDFSWCKLLRKFNFW